MGALGPFLILYTGVLPAIVKRNLLFETEVGGAKRRRQPVVELLELRESRPFPVRVFGSAKSDGKPVPLAVSTPLAEFPPLSAPRAALAKRGHFVVMARAN